MDASAQKKLFSLCLLVLGFFAVNWLGRAAGRQLRSLAGPSASPSLWILAGLPLAGWLAIAWHELGHVAGGWLSGFRLTLFAAGPVMVERPYGRLRLRWNDRLALWGGLAATAPLDGQALDTAALRRAMFRSVAGGPLVSLTGALLMIPVCLALRGHPNSFVLASSVSAMSLMIGLLTLIPSSMGGFRSDGARLLQLWRGGAEAEQWAAMNALSAQTYTSRPRDWPAALLQALSPQGTCTSDGVAAAALRSSHFQDAGQLDLARFWIDEAILGQHLLPEGVRGMLHCSAAQVYALLGQAETARAHLNQVKSGGFVQPEQLLHATALVLRAEGRLDQARDAAAQALRLIPATAGAALQGVREELEGVLVDGAGGRN